MKHAPHILEELKEITPLLSELSAGVPFVVPEGYFETFAMEMLLQKESMIQKPLQSVPDNYFDEFAGKMLAMAKNSEPKNTQVDTPLLDAIDRKMPYTVPEGYFEQFKEQLSDRLIVAPVKSIQSYRNNFVRFSAAAAVLVMLLTGFWIINQPNVTDNTTAAITPVETKMSNIDTETLSDYLENTAKVEEFAYYLIQPVDDIEGSLDQLSTEDLLQFLENSPPVDPGT